MQRELTSTARFTPLAWQAWRFLGTHGQGHPPLRGRSDRSMALPGWRSPGLHALQGPSQGRAIASQFDAAISSAPCRPVGKNGELGPQQRLHPIGPAAAASWHQPASQSCRNTRLTADNAFRLRESVHWPGIQSSGSSSCSRASGRAQLTDAARKQPFARRMSGSRVTYPGADNAASGERHPGAGGKG